MAFIFTLVQLTRAFLSCVFLYTGKQLIFRVLILFSALYNTVTVWLSGNALVSINMVVLRWVRLVLG